VGVSADCISVRTPSIFPKHIVIPEAQHTISACFDLASSQLIRGPLLIVLTSIEFDHLPRLAASEVNDEGADQRLAPKMRSRNRNIPAQTVAKEHVQPRSARRAYGARNAFEARTSAGFDHEYPCL
jgi:hypothetical protein